MNVQTLSPLPAPMSVEDFFAWIATQDARYELVEGTPRLQPWVKRNHNRIVVNLVKVLHEAIDHDRFEIATGDFAIATGPRNVRFADVLVEIAGGSGQSRTTENAVLIAEVLSPSTAAEDFGSKQREYLNLPTLETYLIVAQDTRCIWQWTRDETGEWPERPSVIEDGAVELRHLDAELALDAVYRKVS